MCAFILVSLGCWLYLPPTDWPLAILLGAIASATAPAATVAVIQQYDAKGPLTDTVMAVVGIDDAIALLIYQFASSLALSKLSGQPMALTSTVAMPLLQCVTALLIGFCVGMLVLFLFRVNKKGDQFAFIVVTGIVLSLGLSLTLSECLEHFHCSTLLTTMAMSATLVNFRPRLRRRLTDAIRGFVPYFFALFFILGGAHLDFLAVKTVGVLSLIYLLTRMVGKVSGAGLGARLGKMPSAIQRYAGFCLIPQVGVAVALAYSVALQFQEYPDIVSTCMNVLLFTTLITELIGPFMTRHGLSKAGEIKVQQS